MIVQLIIASGRDVDTQIKITDNADPLNGMTPAEIGRFQGTRDTEDGEFDEDYIRKKENGPAIADLIDSFDADPVTTRQQLRKPHNSRFFHRRPCVWC